MNEWIEINLPWQDRTWTQLTYKPFPDLSERAKAVFGETSEEVKARTIDSEAGTGWSRPIFDRFEEVRGIVEDEMLKENPSQSRDQEYAKELRRRLEALNNSDVKIVFEYRDFNTKHNAWLDSQPENIEITTHNLKLQQEFKERQRTQGSSFVARELNRAGTVVEVLSADGKLNQWMIGALNELGGICDDCSGINDGDIVVRYRVVWQPK